MTTTTVDAVSAHVSYESSIRVDRSPSEVPLLFFVALVSLAVWIFATITIVGLAYALFIGAFFFLGHVIFVAHVRGNGVRVGPEQFPELDAAVRSLARRMELRPVPEVYVIQAGGSLNAFASKFLRSNIVVLFSDLLDACGDDTHARDMIIAHELGHVRAGHLRWAWFLLPGSIVPFLGTALSRAREYTCDAIGVQGAGSRDSAVLGLTILAAGAQHGRLVNRTAMARQKVDLNTGLMRLGEWFSTHPPLARRIAAIDPALDTTPVSEGGATARALLIIGGAVATPVVLTMVAAAALAGVAARFVDPATLAGAEPTAAELLAGDEPVQPALVQAAADAPSEALPEIGSVGLELATIQAKMDLQTLNDAIQAEVAAGGTPPEDADGVYQLLKRRNPEQPEPMDPFDGKRYGYTLAGDTWVLRAAGPDKQPNTVDDIVSSGRR